jgi:hypothetical protein
MVSAILGISVGTIVGFDVPADAELTRRANAIGKGQTVRPVKTSACESRRLIRSLPD